MKLVDKIIELQKKNDKDIDVFVDNKYKFSVSSDECFCGNYFNDCDVIKVKVQDMVYIVYAE